jgi:quercetin dioxygenase-like cupin family protein
MEIIHTKANFSDDRGEIRDILTHVDIDAITYITYAQDSVRGNHFHEHSEQWDYVLTGELECYGRDGYEGELEKEIAGAGDLIRHPIGEHHALKAITPATTLSITKGPRKGREYEQDVVRLTPETKLVS